MTAKTGTLSIYAARVRTMPSKKLSNFSVAIKTCPYSICYKCVQFQIEIWKISRCGSRSPDNTEFGHFTVLQTMTKKCSKNYNARAKPLLCSLVNLLFSDCPCSRCGFLKLSNDNKGSKRKSLQSNPKKKFISVQLKRKCFSVSLLKMFTSPTNKKVK